MHQNYIVPTVNHSTQEIPVTPMLREKWIGAMLDQTGCAYAGALRLDFSPRCVTEKVIDAVAATLARHPILAACFKLDGDALIGHAPAEDVLHKLILDHLHAEYIGITDEMFLAYRAKNASEPGLRLALTRDNDGLHVWIGFNTYTCDGASIDLLVEEISHRYLGKSVKLSQSWGDYAKTEIVKTAKRVVSAQDRLDVYPLPGPYGLDAVRNTSSSSTGCMQSTRFDSSVLRRMLSDYARSHRITLFVLLFAAFQRAISAASGVETIVTGIPFVNRRHSDDYGVVGPLSNTVPVTTHHESGESLVATLDKVQRAVIKAAERQDVETSVLYPEGISPRTVKYDLPFPQLFNAWNSRCDGVPVSLGDSEHMVLNLLPNGTCRAGFEITLDEHTENISGRIDMNIDAYGDQADKVIEHMLRDLGSVNSE